jgi:hypothetical protein
MYFQAASDAMLADEFPEDWTLADYVRDLVQRVEYEFGTDHDL